MKDGLLGIMNGTDCASPESEAEKYKMFVANTDRALVIIVLSVEPSLLHLLGDPEDPAVVWKNSLISSRRRHGLSKLHLWRKLSLHLRDGGQVQKHMKEMVEIFDELPMIGDPIYEEDRDVHLLASSLESYNMLVTTLEANPDVQRCRF